MPARPRKVRIINCTALVMAQAVKRLFPGTRFGIGPAIENGFYYDFDLPDSFSSDDLARIEEEMKKIVEADLPFKRQELDKEKALELFAGDMYKKELIEDLPDESVSIYSQGEFIDLCRGPHLPSTGHIKAFKLINVAGAYWRGDSSRPMLQRIYGVAFPTQGELADHLHMLEEAAKRDHRRLGKELDLFSIHERADSFFHPKGMILRNLLERYGGRSTPRGLKKSRPRLFFPSSSGGSRGTGIIIGTTYILPPSMMRPMPSSR